MNNYDQQKIKFSNFIETNNQEKVVLDWDSFYSIIDKNFWNLLETSEILRIDLQGIDLFKTDGITLLLNCLLQRKLLGFYTTILLPEEFEYLSFFSQIGFINYQWLFNYHFENDDITHNPKLPKADNLKKIFVIHDDYMKIKLYAPLVEQYLAKTNNIKLHTFESEGLEETFTGFMEEWVRNIATHGYPQDEKFFENDLDTLGMLSISLKLGEYPWVRIVLSDAGPGLKKTLQNKKGSHAFLNNCKTDLDAIFSAIMFRKYFIKDRVFGIYSALGFIEKNDGIISIRNGKRLVTINLAEKNNKKIFLAKYNKEEANYEWLESIASGSKKIYPYVRGTQICIDIKTKKPGGIDASY